MNNLTKLAIAIVLAGAAAATNMAWLQQQKTPPMYVGANVNLAPGTVITNESLMPVPIPGDPERIKKSFIPYHDRSVLFGSKAQRHYGAGDMFLYRDMRVPAKRSNWNVLGPFRIVGVGGAFKAKSLNEKQIGGGGNNVTLAVSNELKGELNRLLHVLNNGTKIVAVQVIPSTQVELTKQALKETESDEYVHQTISLSGIESIPTVLYDGEVIRFILEGAPRY